MTNSPKQNVFNPVRVLTSGLGFVFFAVVCLLLSQGAFAETVTVTGMNDSTNYADVDIVDTLGKGYTHKGKITGTSSLTVNAPQTNSNYRQWLSGANGNYTFTGPINVNGGQLLINNSKLSTKTINLNGGDMYVMYADCLPHDAVINVGAGSMLDLESKANAIKGATINVSPGGSFRMCSDTNDSANPITLYIAGEGRPSSTYPNTYSSPGAILARGGGGNIYLNANINLTDNANVFLENLAGKQFVMSGKLTGSSTLTFTSNNNTSIASLTSGSSKLNMSDFAGNFVVDKVKVQFYSDSLGTGSNISVQNSGTAIFNNTAALNNYTGSFTVNNATISLEAAGKLNNLSGDASGTVNNGGKALTLNNTADTEFSGVISGTGTMEKIGDGMLTFSGANTYTGATTVTAGTLKLSGASASLATPQVTISTNGVLQSGVNMGNIAVIVNGGAFTAGDTCNSAQISTKSLTFNSGALNFDFNNSADISDHDTIQTVAINAASGVINLSFNCGDEAAWWTEISSAGVPLVTGNSIENVGVLSVNVNGEASSKWAITSTGSSLYLVAAGDEAPEASKYWFANNPSDIAHGSWNIDGSSKLGVKLPSAPNASVTISNPISMSANGTVEVADNYNLTLSGEISNSGALEKTGKGTLTLSGANSYSGGTTISEGTLKLTENGTLGSGAVVNNSALEFAPSSDNPDQVVNVVISGPGTVDKTDSGKLTFSTANTYTGATTVSGGTLELSAANAIASSGSVVNNAAITMGAAQTINNLEGSGTIDNGGSLLTLNNSADTVYSGVISGSGAVTKMGDNTLTLTGENTYTGKTTVSGGILKLSGNGKIKSSTIDVASGATLMYDNTFPRNTSSLTINVNGGTLEFYNTKVKDTHTGNGICYGDSAGQDVTINGTKGGTLLIDGGGTVSAIDSNKKSGITFALDSSSVFYVKSGMFINGGWTVQNWDNNKAELHIGPTGKVDLWDGKQMRFGGLSGELGAQLVETKGGNGIVVGVDVASDKTYTYSGSISLNNKVFEYKGAGTQNLNGSIEKVAINNTSTGTLNIGGDISNATVTNSSTGTLTISGDMSNTTATATKGTMVLGTASNEMNVGSASTIKANGGTVRVDGNVVVDSGALTVYGTWTGENGSINVKSGGQLTVDSSYTFAKGITLSGGLLVNDSSNGATVYSPVTISSASEVKANGKDLKLAGGLYGSGNLTTTSSASAKWVYLTGEGEFTGNLIVKGYVVTGTSGKGTAAAPYSTTPYLGSGEIQLDGGLLLNNSSYWDVPNTINVVSDSSIRAGYSRPFTFSGNITGSGKLTVENDNDWIIMKTHSDNNSFKGDVQINYSDSSQGRVRLAANQPFGANAGTGRIFGTLDMNGFSQQFKGLHSDGTKGNIYNTTNTQSTLTLDTTSEDNTYYGVIKDNIALNIKGTGTQTFANNGSTFTGDITISGGKLVATATHDSSKTTMALGAKSTPGGRTITVLSGAELSLGAKDILGGCDPGTYSANSARLVINGGKLSGVDNNGLYNATFKNGAELYGNNNRETWQSFWLLGTTNVSFAGDKETPELPVQFNGASGVVFVPYGDPVFNVGDITLNDESDLIVNVEFGNKSSSPVSTNSVTKTGAGTMEFTKANSYTGGTTISEGVLKYTDNAVFANGPITVGDNGTLEYNLSSGKKQLLTLNDSKKISSTGTIVKTGDGTLQIYTDAAGQVDASSFIVSSGRLDMKEFFTGSLEVQSGATMSPGNSVGTLTVDGTAIFETASTLLLEVGRNEQGNIAVDQLIVNGDARFAQGSIIEIGLDPTSGLKGGDEFSDVLLITADNAADIYSVVEKALQSYYFVITDISRDGKNIYLSGRLDPNAVPEPSTWALLVLGAAGLMYWRKRKNS